MSVSSSVDAGKSAAFVESVWPGIQSTLETYISIPNQSPMFDAEHHTNGHTDAVVKLFTEWVSAQAVPGLTMEVRK
jgi:hypothetical protein